MGQGFPTDRTPTRPETLVAQAQQPDFQREVYGAPGDGADRVKVGDPAERAVFRAEAGALLEQVRTQMEAGSDGMRWCKLAASRGIRPTTTAYKEQFDAAKQSYSNGIDLANAALYECYKDKSGRIVPKIDDITGKPIESAFHKRLQQERLMLKQDLAFVDNLIKQGKNLSDQDMRRLGLTTTDAKAAREMIVRLDRVCNDDQRLVGYCEANLGMALIRTSPDHTNVDQTAATIAARQNQCDLGRIMLEKAAQSDPWMLGPPPDANYLRNRREVELIAAAPIPGQPDKPVVPPDKPVVPPDKPVVPPDKPVVPPDKPVVPPDKPVVPPDKPVVPGADRLYDGPGGTKITETQGRRFILDGTYRLPTGRDFPDPSNPNFRDPMDLLDKAVALVKPDATSGKVKVDAATRQSFEQAIAAADELDRESLKTVIGQGQAAVRKWLPAAGPESVTDTVNRSRVVVAQAKKEMTDLGAALVQIPGTDVMLNKLRQQNTTAKLQAFMAANDADVKAFSAVGNNKGQAFLQAMVAYLGRAEQSGILAKLNDEYLSSIDTRALYVKALLDDQSDADKPSAECVAEAKKRVIELVQLDRSLADDKGIQALATKLGIDLAKVKDAVPAVPVKDAPPPVQPVPPKDAPVQPVQPKDQPVQPKDAPGPVQRASDLTPATGWGQIEAIAKEYHQATDKKEVLKTIGPKFVEAMKKVDADFEASKVQITQDFAALQKKMEETLEAKVEVKTEAGTAQMKRGERMEQLGQVLNAEKVKLTENDGKLYNEFLHPSTTEQRRIAIQEYLSKTYPVFSAAAAEFSQLVAPVLKIQQDIGVLNKQAEVALMTQFNARLLQAVCLEAGDDLTGAGKALQEAFNKLPQAYREKAAQDQSLVLLAKKLNVNMNGVETPVAPAVIPVPPKDAPVPPKDAPVPPKDAPNAGLNKPADAPVTLGPLELVALGQKVLQDKGIDHARKYFEDAIKSAEKAVDQAKLLEAIRQAQKALKDNAIDGRALTPGERWATYQALDRGFAQMKLVLELKVVYANALRLADQSESAEVVMRDVVKAADALPIEEMREQVKLIKAECENKAFDSNAKDALMVMAVSLQGANAEDGLINCPINKRKELASFLLGVGKNAKGDWEVGVKDHCRPDKAMEVIDDIKKVYEKRYGIDLDKTPGKDEKLLALTRATIEHLPDNLKAQYEKESGFFHSAMADATAALTGLAIAAIVASILIKNPTLARGALATSEGLTIAGRTVVVTSALASSVAAREGVLWATTGKTDFSTGLTGDNAMKATAHAWGSLAGAYILLKGPGLLGGRAAQLFTPEATLARLAQEVGTVGSGGQKVLTVGRYVQLAGEAGIKLPKAILEAAAKNPSAVLTAEQFALEGMQAANVMGKLLKVGAGTGEALSLDTALAAMTEKLAVAGADGQKVLTMAQYVEIAAANGIKLSEEVVAIAKAAPQMPVTTSMMTFQGMETASMVAKLVPEAAEAAKATTTVLGRVIKPLDTLSHLAPRTLNPATATPGQIAMSKFGAQYTSALTGLGVFNSTARTSDLMGTINPKTQKPYEFSEALLDTNFGGRHSKEWTTKGMDNVFFHALIVAPFLATGPYTVTPWRQGASLGDKAFGVLNPFSTKMPEWLGTMAAQRGWAAASGTSLLINGRPIVDALQEHRPQANTYQDLLNKTKKPLTDAESRPLAGKKDDKAPGPGGERQVTPGPTPTPYVAPPDKQDKVKNPYQND